MPRLFDDRHKKNTLREEGVALRDRLSRITDDLYFRGQINFPRKFWKRIIRAYKHEWQVQVESPCTYTSVRKNPHYTINVVNFIKNIPKILDDLRLLKTDMDRYINKVHRRARHKKGNFTEKMKTLVNYEKLSEAKIDAKYLHEHFGGASLKLKSTKGANWPIDVNELNLAEDAGYDYSNLKSSTLSFNESDSL